MEMYTITSKLFARRTLFNSKENGATSVPYEVHPWISKAAEETKQIPNPKRPQYYDCTEGVLQKLEDTDDPRFHRNDIILVSCRITFVVSGDSWWTEIVPLQLVRVDRLPDITGTASDVSLYPGINDDFTPLEVGETLEFFDSDNNS